jgi:hypothetical protein
MIEGAAAIAEFIYRSRDARYRRKVYYLAETSKIPIRAPGFQTGAPTLDL